MAHYERKQEPLDPNRIQNTRDPELGLRTKVHRWCETQVLIGWNFLVSRHDVEYNFVFTPCYQSPLCFHLLDFGILEQDSASIG